MTMATPEAILGLGRNFMGSRILLTAVELDVFTLLAKKPLTAGEAARKLGAKERGTAILLDALAAMELLKKRNGRYACTPPAAAFLAEGSPASLLPMLMHSAHLWNSWSKLTERVRRGRVRQGLKVLSDDKHIKAFIGAMHVAAGRTAGALVKAVRPGGAKRLLDVGGASGTYTQAFLEQSPAMRATLFDLPPVIRLARARLKGTALSGRVDFVPGDFYRHPLPHGHDLALLSAIIHMNGPEENAALYKKIYSALQPGGRLVIRDHVMSEDHTAPRSGALFAVNMLAGTPNGATYSFSEIRADLRAAGFTGVRQLQSAEMSSLVEAVKPAK